MTDNEISTVLKRIPYGFYSITSRGDQDVNAMVLNWLTQLSFDPQLIAIGLQKTSFTRELIEQGMVFAVNLFVKEDADLIKPFTKSRAKNPDKMKGVEWNSGAETGCPIIQGAAAYLECEVTSIHDTGGGYDIIVGKVIGAGVLKEGQVEDTLTLLDLGWSYAG